MLKIPVFGDNRVGKTTFLHISTGTPKPLNIFRTRYVEAYAWSGALNATYAQFLDVPGDASDDTVRDACDGADAVMVLYAQDKGLGGALSWLRRLTRLTSGIYGTHVMICGNTDTGHICAPTPMLTNMLHRYPNAEHTYTSLQHPVGIVDCANRIIKRCSRSPRSPVYAKIPCD